ncbi:MAG TPA: redoxin domain-containing protein [Patescibacteria group bacterium]|nr:redoxin domain-containing protein [Patescibacteria group bacterium]
MKKIIIIISAILIFGFILAGAWEERNTKQVGNSGDVLGKAQALVGQTAPAFVLTDMRGATVTNDTLKGKKVVLFFNEGLGCYPACWNEMLALAKDARFQASDVIVMSVVLDSRDMWVKAITNKSDLSLVNVMFDKGGTASAAFGMLSMRSSMHPGAPGHSYVVLDRDGTVQKILDDPKMGNNTDVIAKIINTLS